MESNMDIPDAIISGSSIDPALVKHHLSYSMMKPNQEEDERQPQTDLQCPAIAGQAQGDPSIPSVEIPQPFSLLGGILDLDSLQKDIAILCNTHVASIEDAYPCTPLQEDLLSLSARCAGDDMIQFTAELGQDVQLVLFKEAWQKTVNAASILRTRIVRHSQHGLMQVVVQEDVDWIEAQGLKPYLQMDRDRPMRLGHRLSRYAIVKDGETLRPRLFV